MNQQSREEPNAGDIVYFTDEKGLPKKGELMEDSVVDDPGLPVSRVMADGIIYAINKWNLISKEEAQKILTEKLNAL